MIYEIPDEFYFRIHHVRPRFKDDVENVLFYVAQEISDIGRQEKDFFKEKLNEVLYQYPGNATKALKTINNWRTEISALFGFIISDDNYSEPSRMAKELAEQQDLVKFFKQFLFTFQYPGAHIKSTAVLEQISEGIHFKPAQYILSVLHEANANGGNSIGITKGEICHCIFNDLRVTRDNESAKKTWHRIKENRQKDVDYDMTGDIIRYAGDIVDYMELANLLKSYDGYTYYLNTLENDNILKFISSKEWFSSYDEMIKNRHAVLDEVNSCALDWFKYVNRNIEHTDFSTDIVSYISENIDEANVIRHTLKEINSKLNERFDKLSTKEIGDMGESLVHGHECMRLKLAGRDDLIHLVKRIPTQFALGYDILSQEVDDIQRYIEVKTTISSRDVHFNRVHLTKNEWKAAETTHEHYYVYRLLLTKHEVKLFLLQDPVGLYKKDLISMIPDDGADISFNPSKVGKFEELLIWKN